MAADGCVPPTLAPSPSAPPSAPSQNPTITIHDHETEKEHAMGVELATAAAIPPEQRYRKGLSYPNPLAGNPGTLGTPFQ